MSPAAFTQQVGQLLHEMNECYKYCLAVRQNRRLGSKHENLDRLEDSLSLSRDIIQSKFEALRRDVGSRMDFGDEIARQSIDNCTRLISSEITMKLYDIAYRREIQLPGFKNLLKSWKMIEDTVLVTLSRLAQRLATSAAAENAPARAQTSTAATATVYGTSPKSTMIELHSGEMIVSTEVYDRLVAHMANSWSERISENGETFYMNALNGEKLNKRPDGYVKRLRRDDDWEEIDRRPIRRDAGARFTEGW